MFGFLKKIMSGAQNPAGPESAAAAEEYKGFMIRAEPQPEGRQFRVAGVISRGDTEKRFVRSDLIADRATAESISLDKARLIIDQRGEGLLQVEHL